MECVANTNKIATEKINERHNFCGSKTYLFVIILYNLPTIESNLVLSIDKYIYTSCDSNLISDLFE